MRRVSSKSEGAFHITIGHSINDDNGINLRGEIETAKLAALYGDTATLISLRGKSFEIIREVFNDSGDGWDTAKLRTVMGGNILEIFNSYDVMMDQLEDALHQISEIEKKSTRRQLRSTPGYISTKKSIADLERRKIVAKSEVGTILKGLGYFELEKLIEAGILLIDEDNSLDMGENATDSYFRSIFDIFNKKKHTYPLFDDDTANIVRLGIKEGKISPGEVEMMRSRQIALPADFLSRLPNFSQASASEIIDIRRTLEKYLVRFRAAILKYFLEVENAAWDEDFKFDAELLYQSQVAPAVQEIEEAVEANRISKHISSNLLTKGATSGVFSVVLSNLDAIANALGKEGTEILGAGIGAVASILNDYSASNANLRKNGLYFLYQAKKRLT